MRSFDFTLKNIGREQYLTYVSGDGSEIDEDVLDFCEENDIAELIKVVFEQDDDYDYLTYDITGKTTVAKFTEGVVSREKVLKIIRNVALGLISCKEHAIHLSYLLLNRNFMYINPETLDIQFLCLPVESSSALSVEFKGFVRQFLANLVYDVDEDLSYVGQLLTYINGDSFNLRGLIGLTEALMEDAGISYQAEEGIKVDGGEEVVSDGAPEQEPETDRKDTVSDFMKDLGDADVPLPEIGDDEEDEEAEEAAEEEAVEAAEEAEEAEEKEAGDEEPAAADREEAEAAAEDENLAAPEDDGEEIEITEAENPEAEAAGDIPVMTMPDFADFGEPEEHQKPAGEEPEQVEAEKAEEAGEKEKTVEAQPETETETEPEDTAAESEGTEEPETDTMPDDTVSVRKSSREIHAEKAESEEEVKARLQQLMGNTGKSDEKQRVFMQKPIKVSRAAIINNAKEQEEEIADKEKEKEAESTAESAADAAEISSGSKNAEEKKAVTEDIIDLGNTGEMHGAGGPAARGATTANNTIFGNGGTLRINPYLVRVNTEEKTIINKPVFKIGKANRGVDYHVSGNGAISRQHAVILRKGDSYYIKDNKSTNHTYVDEVRVEEGEERLLSNGCTIRLGDEDFTFKLQ